MLHVHISSRPLKCMKVNFTVDQRSNRLMMGWHNLWRSGNRYSFFNGQHIFTFTHLTIKSTRMDRALAIVVRASVIVGNCSF